MQKSFIKAADGSLVESTIFQPMETLGPKTVKTYFWKAYREWDREIFVESDGSWVSWTNDDKTDDTFKFELKHNGQKWEIIDYVSVED